MRRFLPTAAAIMLVGSLLSNAPSAAAQVGAGHDPIGAVDAVSVRALGAAPSFRDQVAWQLSGWAADPDAPGELVAVHLYMDGRGAPAFTGQPRPDVSVVHQFAGTNSGWTGFVSYPNDGRVHRVCAYAVNVGAGSTNPLLGCRDLPPGGSDPGDPVGVLDVVTITPGLVRFQGWALDPDVTPGDGPFPPTRVRPVIDGFRFDDWVGTVERPDVQAAGPNLRYAQGFDESFPLPPGRHSYCLYALNAGRSGVNNTAIGCGVVDVPPSDGSVRGAIDVLRSATNYSGIEVSGWAWDRTTSQSVQVRVRTVATRDFVLFPGVGLRDGSTGLARSDVSAALPGAPGDTGFRIIDATPLPEASVVFACAYAVIDGAEELIGCRGAD